jgi:pimeloyl-ACP methyl ester carboxylesterase
VVTFDPDAGSTPDGGAAPGEPSDFTAAFGGGFAPRDAPDGGFGGGACVARKTPVVFLHGNADQARTWARASSDGGPSVLAAFFAAGYTRCELFGLNWLAGVDAATPQRTVHTAARAQRVRSFLDDVRRYTGKAQVDLVAHSMGVTVGLHALEGTGQAAGTRRFVAIAGGLRGLDSCLNIGPANPLWPNCGAQSLADHDLFGFYPLQNPRLEGSGFRSLGAAATAGSPLFSSIHAGQSDEILCPSCDTALFTPGPNVQAQLDVGRGSPSIAVTGTDDTQGVGHFRAKSDSGALLLVLLGTDCVGQACCASLSGKCR